MIDVTGDRCGGVQSWSGTPAPTRGELASVRVRCGTTVSIDGLPVMLTQDVTAVCGIGTSNALKTSGMVFTSV